MKLAKIIKKGNDADNSISVECASGDEQEVMNFDEEQCADDSAKVSSEKMNKVIDLLQDKYNLKGNNFELIGYADKGNKIVATLANTEYEVQFTIKSQDILLLLGV